MSRYDGLIIPRSYSEYINKTDAATLQQALQLSGVLSGTVAAGDNKAVKSDAVNTAIEARENFPINTSVSSYNDLYVNGKTTRYTVANGVANAPSDGAFMVTSVSSPAQVSSNYYGYQIAVQVGNGINMATYIRLKNGSNNWTAWTKVTTDQVDRLTITVTTPFGTIHALQNGKVIQVSMNGSSGETIPPGTELATLPKPAESLFIPVFKYNTQAVIGLLQLNNNGKLIAYSGNTQNLDTAVYSFTYIAA